MSPSLLRQSARYGTAVLASGTALIVHRVLISYVGPGLPTYLLFYPAVMLTATVYGLGPGLLATAVSALLVAYFILPPDGLAVGSPVDLLGLVIFAWMGTGISLVAAWYRRAQDRAAGATAVLGRPAEEAASLRAPHRLGDAPGAVPRRIPVRRWLTLLVLGTAMPLLVFAIVVLVWLVGEYRADQDRRQTDTTRALALAVDAEIRSWKAALQALAGSHELQQGRLASFYQEAVAVAAQHEGWIVLTDASGQQWLNTRRAFGDLLPKTGTPDVIQAVFRTRQPVVTDLVFGAVSQRYIVAVVVPVIRDGRVLYSLDMAFGPERLVGLLADQRLPATWILGITDGRQRVVARVPDRPDRRGQPALPPLARVLAAQDSGTIEAALADGRVGRFAFEHLREAPWAVNVTVPVTELQAAWQRPVLAFLLLGGLAVFGAIGLAVGLARKIARPVTEAATLAATVVQGQMPALAPSGIAEVAALQDALADSAITVRTATQAREEALTALRAANAGLETRVQERTAGLTKTAKDLEEANAELHRQVEERQKAEAALQSMARFPDESPGPILRVARDGTLLYANRASGLLLTTWGFQVGQRLPEPWGIRLTDAYDRGRVDEIEVGGEADRVYACTLTPITNAGYLNLYLRDITEQTVAAEALRRVHDELERRVQARTVELSAAIAKLEQQAAQLQTLTGDLALAEERERHRLGQLLHDGLQQLLVAARVRMQLWRRGDPSRVPDGFDEAVALLDDAVTASRSLSAELSPPILYAAGFEPALRWLARWMENTHHLTVDLKVEPQVEPGSEAAKVLLFQSVRELLFNVVKHAGVPLATVEVSRADAHIQIAVADQGSGFDPERLQSPGVGGLGLPSIRQRLEYLGGTLEIASTPGQGSRFTLTVPLPPSA